MKMQNNDTKDEGLKGNEKIEEAISALQQEPSQAFGAYSDGDSKTNERRRTIDSCGRAFCCRTTEDTGSEDS